MLRLRFSALLLCIGLVTANAFADAPNPSTTPAGRWLTADHSAVIQIAPCGRDLCGQIVGIALSHPNDPMPTDWLGQPQCGLTIIQTAPVTEPSGATAWQGVVLDPRNGVVHPARLMLDAFRHLLLRGYALLPIFGQTQTWTPYPGRTLANCHLAAAPEAKSNS